MKKDYGLLYYYYNNIQIELNILGQTEYIWDMCTVETLP